MMKNKLYAGLTLASTIYMMMGSFLMIALFGFDPNPNNVQPPVRLFLEPAGYAFVIWSFIYVGYIALGIYQYLPEQRTDPRLINARKYIVVNALANNCWFVGVVQNQLWFTVVCMLVMLYTLIKIAILIELEKPGKDLREKLMVKLPVALYFGWITIATPINITSFLLAEVGWTGQSFLGPEIWSVLIMIVAFLIVGILFYRQKVNAVYLLVGVWGLFAIYIANLPFSKLVAWSALLLSIGLLLALIGRVLSTKKGVALL